MVEEYTRRGQDLVECRVGANERAPGGEWEYLLRTF